jgi:hypothetical protein
LRYQTPLEDGLGGNGIMQVMRVISLASFLGLALCGCGQRTLSTEQTYPVHGRVLYKGKPASFVIVHFEPTGKKGAEAVGRTDKNGMFELRTFSNEAADGAVPGEYKVSIEEFDPVQAAAPKGAKGTKIEGGRVLARQTYEVLAEDNDITVQAP